MAITPSTDVILLKCPLELDQANQLNFANATAQYNYFYNLPKKIVGDDFTYQRKDSYIDVEGVVDEYYSYNYVMYRNENYSNKWFYAFIEKLEFVNTDTTRIYIKTDTFQTWQFALTYKSSFIEREHTNDDTIGKNTVPEGLDLGEFEIVKMNDISLSDAVNTNDHDAWVVCFSVTALPEGCEGAVDGRVAGDNGFMGGVFNPLKFFATAKLEGAKKVIRAYDTGSVNADAIVNVYMIPWDCVNTTVQTHTDLVSGSDRTTLYPISNYTYTNDAKIQQQVKLAENYTPINKKLYCSPFSYIYMSNNCGTDVELKWEDFPIETVSGTTMPTMTYYKYLVPSTSLSAKIIFTKYKTFVSDSSPVNQMVNYGINYGKIPVCAWPTDYYTNWLTQNGVNVQTSFAGAGLTALGGVVVGSMLGGAAGAAALAGGILSAGSQVMNTMAEVNKAATIPPQSHGDINTGDLVYCLKRNSISCYHMSIRKEVAQRIDSFFQMYGYKTNQVKTPNITGRANWNYVKTIGCYILADIPQEDLQEIKNMFDNGLTIWHNPSTFRDYSQSNAIVS